MKKTYLVLAFLITGFLLVGDAYGEDEVYYCVEIDRNGFSYDKKNETYLRRSFKESKFKKHVFVFPFLCCIDSCFRFFVFVLCLFCFVLVLLSLQKWFKYFLNYLSF